MNSKQFVHIVKKWTTSNCAYSNFVHVVKIFYKNTFSSSIASHQFEGSNFEVAHNKYARNSLRVTQHQWRCFLRNNDRCDATVRFMCKPQCSFQSKTRWSINSKAPCALCGSEGPEQAERRLNWVSNVVWLIYLLVSIVIDHRPENDISRAKFLLCSAKYQLLIAIFGFT